MALLVWYGIVGFNVPLDTLWVILETILRVVRPNKQTALLGVSVGLCNDDQS